MYIGRALTGALCVAGGVAGGWLLFQSLAPDPAPAAAANVVDKPAGTQDRAVAPTVIVVPIALPPGGSLPGAGGSAPGTESGAWTPGGSSSGTSVHATSAPAPAGGVTVPIPMGQMLIAHDGSIVVVGDDAVLTANTGDTAAVGPSSSPALTRRSTPARAR